MANQGVPRIDPYIWWEVQKTYDLTADEAIAVLALRDHQLGEHGRAQGCCLDSHKRIMQLTAGRLTLENQFCRIGVALNWLRHLEKEAS